MKKQIILLFMLCPIMLFSYVTTSGNVSGQYWHNTDTYYVIGDLTVDAGTTFEIQAGTIVKFAGSTKIDVYGTMIANGNSTSNIIFTSSFDNSVGEVIENSRAPEPGDWAFIALNGDGETNQGIGNLDYCKIYYGGKYGYSSQPNVIYNSSDSGYFTNSLIQYSYDDGLQVSHTTITATNNSFLDCNDYGVRTSSAIINLDNSIFNNNGNSGIYANNGTLEINNCQFNNNANYAAYLNNVEIKTYTNNTGSGNTINAFGISGTINQDITLSESVTGFPYVLIGTTTLNANYTMTIPTGEIIKCMGGGLKIFGSLNAIGTSANNIVFTSLYDDTYGGDWNSDGDATTPSRGNWSWISMDGDGETNQGIGNLDYCKIYYGGKYGYSSQPNVIYNSSDSGYFTNSLIQYSYDDGLQVSHTTITATNSSFLYNNQYGVYVDNSTVVLENSIVNNNIESGIYAINSELDINNCQFNDNGSYGVYLTGNTLADFGTNSRNPGINEFINNDSGNIQFYNATANTINAYHNKWNYFNANDIDSHIYDDDENAGYGEVLFDPWFVENVEITLMTADPLDFEMLYYGLEETLPVVVQNDGTVDLLISEVTITNIRTDVFEFVYDNLNNPIAPGEQDTIYVTFTPDAEQSYEDTLNIVNNSSNQPLLQVTLQGAGEYDEIPAPQNVTIDISNGDAIISWDAVTETVHGIPISPDFYVINYSETVEEDPEAYYHLVMINQTSFVHVGVNYFADQMFYQVIAIRDYEGQYTSRMSLGNQQEIKITWGDYKKMIGIK